VHDLMLRDVNDEMHMVLTLAPVLGPSEGRLPPRLAPSTARLPDAIRARCMKLATSATKLVRADLIRRYPAEWALECLQIVYPSYWQQRARELASVRPMLKAATAARLALDFTKKVDLVEKHYGTPIASERWQSGVVQPRINMSDLREQATEFSSLAFAAAANMTEVDDLAGTSKECPIGTGTRMWQLLDSQGEKSAVRVGCSEWVKLAEMAMVMVPGSAEDERNFSSMGFLKDDERNSLTVHLTTALRLYKSKMFTVLSFPYKAAVKIWRNARSRRAGMHR
jgi:hypothetical protein